MAMEVKLRINVSLQWLRNLSRQPRQESVCPSDHDYHKVRDIYSNEAKITSHKINVFSCLLRILEDSVDTLLDS